jgi:AraC family transcriptional regulator
MSSELSSALPSKLSGKSSSKPSSKPYGESKTLFASTLLRIGHFQLHPRYTQVEHTSLIVSGHLIVFPRTSVCITHPGSQPIIADPNVVMFYNLYSTYRRRALTPEGDRCEWFAFAPTVLAEALRPFDPAAADNPECPFRLTHGPVDATSYLLQRRVVEHVLHMPNPNQLFVEESMLGVLHTVLHRAYGAQGLPCQRVQTLSVAKPVAKLNSAKLNRARLNTEQTHQELAFAVQEMLTTRFREEVSLTQLAAAVYTSPYHLCRIFRQQIGLSIHQYLNQLRLRTALEELPSHNSNLTQLALSLGYNSHSHFTSAFRQTFGVPPSQMNHLQK